MASFNSSPANLNDGELRLPLNIFPAEPRLLPNNNNLNFFDHRRQILNSKLPIIPKGFSGQYPSQNGYYGSNMGPTVDHCLLRNPKFLTNPVPPRQPLYYPIHCPQGSKLQLMDNRVGGSNRHVHVQPPTRNQNRVLPFHENPLDLAFRFGNRFIKEGNGAKTGTGVFIPLAPSHHKTTTNVTPRKNLKPGATPGRRGGRKVNEGTDKTEEKDCNTSELIVSSEIRLPNEWTY